jgi:hypothetical protein
MWRISKYDPALRNKAGAYTPDVWTSISDIGKQFGDVLFQFDEYLAIEQKYILAGREFIEESGIPSLTVSAVERIDLDPGNDGELFSAELLADSRPLQNGQVLGPDEIENVCRLNLREIIWCKLESPGKFYIHFGYDYYMYIGSIDPCSRSLDFVNSIGLFSEETASPYL